MSRQGLTGLIVAAVLALSAALYLSAQRNVHQETRSGALLPSLAGELNSVTALTVRRAGTTPVVIIHQKDGRWTVAERDDYPADVSKLRKLLLALSDAKIVEQKTSDPAKFPIIGVEDPVSATATGAEISVTAKDGKHAVIVGKSSGNGIFARRSGENTSYIVEPVISFEAEPRYWIDPHLLDVAAAGIQSIEFKPATGPGYTVHRPAAGGNFVLDGVPSGRKAAEPASLAPSQTTYSGLTADDVLPVGNVDFNQAIVVTVTLADGNVITVTGASSGDKRWVQLKSTKDAALNARAAGRAFEISSYRYDAIFRPLEQLLVPKEAPPAKKPAAGAASSKPVPSPAP
jgi:hypothetical protein